MKKILTTIALVLVLALCMAVPAFAEETAYVPDVDTDRGSASVEVDGVYTPGSVAAEVISVDVSWGSLAFTYHDAVGGTWNAAEHDYIGDNEAYWDHAEKANEIKVTNHSNTAVEAQLTFEKATGTDIEGEFEEDYGTADDGIMPIVTAENTAFASAPSVTAKFNITAGSISAPAEENETVLLGTITLTIVNK